MADSAVIVTQGAGTNIDTRTETTNSNHRQVVVIGDPGINDNVINAVTADPGQTSTTSGLVVRLAGSARIHQATAGTFAVYFDPANPAVNISSFTGSLGVFFDRGNPTVTVASITNTVGVFFDRGNPAVNLTSGTLTNITNTVAVYFDRGNPTVTANAGTGTFNVAFSPAVPTVAVSGITNTVGVYFDRGNPAVNLTSGTLTNITNTVAVYFDRANPSVSVSTVTGSIGVYFDRGNPAVNITSFTGSLGVYFDRGNPTVTANAGTGTFTVAFSPAKPIVLADTSATAIVPTTVSGSTSTAGNNTLVSPEAGQSIKVYAYSITTTAQVHIVPRFTTGASAGATERWRVGLQAPSAGVAGANLAVSPPGYLFAMGTNTTLALYIDTASLVHYAVAYFKETG